jgi:hypothetical protein
MFSSFAAGVVRTAMAISSARKADPLAWKHKETLARRAIEDQGFIVHDANVVFRENCPNIDLVVFGRYGAIYVQVKASTNPAGKDAVLVDGSPWIEAQLFEGAPIYNKHGRDFQAQLVLIVDVGATGTDFYLARPDELESIAREVGSAFALKPKRNGERRKMFRKEVPRSRLERWRGAWGQLKALNELPLPPLSANPLLPSTGSEPLRDSG